MPAPKACHMNTDSRTATGREPRRRIHGIETGIRDSGNHTP
ncbi:hypothetical protein dsmv_0182 [Desulfococcus multivorans DSM 2059]|uniref:Uncharacterized protein n=1 Tax=Desulfococcus multivorans DSM 2059 TaxID=1121405 RepID=S7TNM9_DESML|nr:uncharacterized protein Dmul_09150 [Desulfococcus multivorans]EPR38772.1 hypothetical protein dsmv_0182 [Desulfococcus multivorans DSM 2059]SJZ78968.1 hypothetical protein SAMN02745446_01672 [Desulfococcus multivorans DSM 2059]